MADRRYAQRTDVSAIRSRGEIDPATICPASIDLGALFGCMVEVAGCGFHRNRNAPHETDIQALDDQLATVTWSADQRCPGCDDHEVPR